MIPNKYLTALALLLASVVLCTIVAWTMLPPSVATPRLTKESVVAMMTADGTITGKWRRVPPPGDKEWQDGERTFQEPGDVRVRYGDVIFLGEYKVIDKETMETTYRFKNDMSPRIYRWTFGFIGQQLVMVNHATDWVEYYERVEP